MAAKVFKPTKTYDAVKAAAEGEFGKLALLVHPRVTAVFDAFEFRDTFFIITERCASSLAELVPRLGHKGLAWIMPVAVSVL